MLLLFTGKDALKEKIALYFGYIFLIEMARSAKRLNIGQRLRGSRQNLIVIFERKKNDRSIKLVRSRIRKTHR